MLRNFKLRGGGGSSIFTLLCPVLVLRYAGIKIKNIETSFNMWYGSYEIYLKNICSFYLVQFTLYLNFKYGTKYRRFSLY